MVTRGGAARVRRGSARLLPMKLPSSHLLGLAAGLRPRVLADTVNDASSTHKVYLLAAALAALGIALVFITLWFWRSTRHDPELLAPLETIGARRFRKLDGGSQQALLDGARPAAATPMRWGVQRGGASGEPEIDLHKQRGQHGGYEDLHDPALIAVAMAESPEAGSEPVVLANEPAARISAVDDIDSALAAVGAKVELPAGAAAEPSPVVSSAGAASSSPAGAPTAVEPSPAARSVVAAKPAAGALPGIGSTPGADPGWDGSIGVMPGTKTAADASDKAAVGASAGAKAPGLPLLIVPVDHELRPSAVVPLQAEPVRVVEVPEVEPVDEDATSAADLPDEQPASIDPLLRMFHRNDS
ncbi:MAG: hypothetical protein JWM34_1578 [Ilumatobacteraceae bacterium]|nr:hypothetical protein [Ilumatobacteraceae bacterium]